MSKSRRGPLCHTRQICIFLGRMFFKCLSYSELGKLFLKKHSTVISAIKTIACEREYNKELNQKLVDYIDDIKLINNTPDTIPDIDVISDSITLITERMRIIAEAYCQLTNNQIIAIK
ncbi:MAG: hypothetical protein M0P71_13195 [Melioribacteraceae bacterium]|nr:hypothetical protein [Melioribacteraceae bacterium]